MSKAIRVTVLLIAVAFAAGAAAEEENLFAEGNAAYGQGDFQAAVDRYEVLIKGGTWHANVFYNLGNAYYRLANFGKAILNYERALALEPRHPEADANLRLARDEARALELGKDWVERYAAMATAKQYSIAAAAGFWIVVFIAANLLLSRKRSVGLVVLAGFGIVITAVSIFAIVTLEKGAGGRALAIVTGKNVEARIATADSAQTVLALPAGSEIKVLSERGDWLYAALPNDQRGWIPTSAAERVRM